jgi:hypothetical protein
MKNIRLSALLLAFLVPAACQAQPAATLGRPRPLYDPASSGSRAYPTVRMSEYEPDPSPAERAMSASFQPSFTPPDIAGPVGSPSPDSGKAASESFLSGRPDTDKRTSNYEHRSNFGEQIMEWLQPGCNTGCDTKRWFESDHAFDYFASPVTMPFFFEDPRALTELRPIITYQSIPSGDIHFKGGNAEFYGLQGRVAFNDRISFVFNELGFVDFNPGSGSSQPGGAGFAEIRLGPKFTFVRDTQNCFLVAAGLTFDVPTGPSKVYQDTGSLSIIPYLSLAKNFGDTRFGSFNFMYSVGYAFATDNLRSDYLYNVFHIDWDVANWHRFYPMMEFGYLQYTRSGSARNLNVEGADLANFGDVNSGGRANFDWAIGFRYKFNESMQVGFACQFPIGGRKDIDDFRLTVDFIWRY